MNLNQCDRGDNGGRQKDRGGKDDFAGWVVIMARNLARGRWLVNSFEADVPGSLSFLRPVELSQGLICAHCLDSRSLRDVGRCWLRKEITIKVLVAGNQQMGGTPRCGAPSLAWEWNALAKKGGGDIWRQKRPRDNEVQWHHGMAGAA